MIIGMSFSLRVSAELFGDVTDPVRYAEEAALVARAAPERQRHSIGVDAEPHDSTDAATLDLIAGQAERCHRDALTAELPGLHWDRIRSAQ